MDNVNYCKFPLPITVKVVTVFLADNKYLLIANSNLSKRVIGKAIQKELQRNNLLHPQKQENISCLSKGDIRNFLADNLEAADISLKKLE